MAASVFLVGAGPGDPGLITVKGRRCIARADVIVYDHLVNPRLLDDAKEGAELIYAGKCDRCHLMEQADINKLLIARAGEGKIVARLKGGDPFVFGRGSEEALALAEAAIPFEVVPGVTAAAGAAACAGIPVTHRSIASSVTFVTGHQEGETSSIDWSRLAAGADTLCIYMGARGLSAIANALIEGGRSPSTPAAVIHRGSWPQQLTVTGTLADIARKTDAAGVEAPLMTIVGDVVRLQTRLSWFEARPLFGRRIVVTRARSQARGFCEGIEEMGASVIEFPTIRIEPPEDEAPLAEAVRHLERFDWIVFTSTNAVDAVLLKMRATGLDARALGDVKICSIGDAVTTRLSEHFIAVDCQPARASSNEVAAALKRAGKMRGKSLLLPRADIADVDLPARLNEMGADVTEVIAYRTVPEAPDSEALEEMLLAGEIDLVTLTSPSTAVNFVRAISIGAARLNELTEFAAIGPRTAGAAGRLGLEVAVESSEQTMEGFSEAILAHFMEM